MRKRKSESDGGNDDVGGDIAKLAKAAVESLKAEGLKEQDAALAKGRAIDVFARGVRGLKRRAPNKMDPYRILSEAKGCDLEPSQLRNYHDYYVLRTALGRDGKKAPDVSLSHYVAVIPMDELETKRGWLEKAAKNSWSVARMKEEIAGEKGPRAPRYWRDELDLVADSFMTGLGTVEQAWKSSGEPLGKADIARFEEITGYIAYTFLSGDAGKGGAK